MSQLRISSRTLFIAVLILLGAQALAPQRSSAGGPLRPAAQTTPTATPVPLPPSDFALNWNVTSGAPIIISTPTFSGTTSFTLQTTNITTTTSYRLSIPDLPKGWKAFIIPGDQVSIGPASSISTPKTLAIVVRISVPPTASVGIVKLTLRATKVNTNQQANASFLVNVGGGAGSTICPESPDPGNDLKHASLILVNSPETHGLCSTGDEDWFKFGGVASKVYTIAITNTQAGLDPLIELYDDKGNFIDANDDNTTNLGSPTVNPIIKSFRAPRNALYFIRVRDTLGIGGRNLTYNISVSGESYGTDPNTVPPVASICNDKYEQDGLPEVANLLTSNEIQKEHFLCPSGDADWVRFFGLSGYTYQIATNTADYKNNGVKERGADTIMNLFGRDGLTFIATNNNYNLMLDSIITFTPRVDGFYFVQIKNVGDIGNQFIKYDLNLSVVCVPEVPCSIGAPPPPPAVPPAPAPAQPTPLPAVSTNNGGNPNTDSGNFLEGSSPDSRALQVSSTAADIPPGFADVAFAQVWQRTDLPIARQRVTRGWMWGPRGGLARMEGYVQMPGGLRHVQYFDKGRMEINDPNGDRNSRWFVTSGLLVVELITGRLQLGDHDFAQRSPSDLPIAGDADDPAAPTYASFGGVTGQLASDRTGQITTATINRAGQVSEAGGPNRAEARLAHFVAESKHNIPQVFWSYMNAGGPIYQGGRYQNAELMDWMFTMGLPISEPFWTRARVGGVERDVLVQAFERRVLTYLPAAPRGWQVQMGNVGRHYYHWRYNEDWPS